jgi:CheY-like chemotaxis protein
MELAARYAGVTLQRSRVVAPVISLVQLLVLATSTGDRRDPVGAAGHAPRAEPLGQRRRDVRVVVAEHHEPVLVRATTARMLERLGLRTLAADGAVFRALRERSNVHVLIATGYAVEEDLQRLVATGARLIEKPFKLAALETEVERAPGRASDHSRQVAHSSA